MIGKVTKRKYVNTIRPRITSTILSDNELPKMRFNIFAPIDQMKKGGEVLICTFMIRNRIAGVAFVLGQRASNSRTFVPKLFGLLR